MERSTRAADQTPTPSSWAAIRRVALALTLLLTACGGQLRDEGALAAGQRVPGLIVLPIAVNIAELSSLEVAWRSVEVANWLLQRTDLPVIGPLDFKLNKAIDQVQVAAYDTDLSTREDELGPAWRDWLVVQVQISENRATNVRDIVDVRGKEPGKPKVYRQHGVEASLRVEAGLFDARRGKRLAWAVIERTDDPTQFAPGEDPRPGVTAAVRDAVQRLLELSPGLFQGPTERRTRGQGFVDAVPALLAFDAPDLPSTVEGLKNLPEAVQEARVYAAWDRVAPGLTVQEIRSATLARGVLVRDLMPPLRQGDVVLAVGKQKVSAIHQLDRLIAACSAKPQGCEVLVRRGEAEVALSLSWPALSAVSPP